MFPTNSSEIGFKKATECEWCKNQIRKGEWVIK